MTDLNFIVFFVKVFLLPSMNLNGQTWIHIYLMHGLFKSNLLFVIDYRFAIHVLFCCSKM